VSSKVKIDTREILNRLKEKLKRGTSSSQVSSSATSSESIQKSPSVEEVSKAKDALKAALSFNFETMIQPEILTKLKGALEVLTSSEGIPDVPQDQLRQFKAVLPSLIQDYQKNMIEIQETKNRQSRFTDLGQALVIGMDKMENFQHRKEQLSLQKNKGIKKIKEIQDNIALMQQQMVQLQAEDIGYDEKIEEVIHEEEEVATAIQPLIEEHDLLNAEIPQVEARLETLVTNLSTSTAPWDNFKANVLEKI
jgi:chromosome segregation ATPase